MNKAGLALKTSKISFLRLQLEAPHTDAIWKGHFRKRRDHDPYNKFGRIDAGADERRRGGSERRRAERASGATFQSQQLSKPVSGPEPISGPEPVSRPGRSAGSARCA